jgi:hypothetical protein
VDKNHVFAYAVERSGLDSRRPPLLEPIISFRLVGPASQPGTTIKYKKRY